MRERRKARRGGPFRGGVAQLVERYVRNVEVDGSSPFTSTGGSGLSVWSEPLFFCSISSRHDPRLPAFLLPFGHGRGTPGARRAANTVAPPRGCAGDRSASGCRRDPETHLSARCPLTAGRSCLSCVACGDGLAGTHCSSMSRVEQDHDHDDHPFRRRRLPSRPATRWSAPTVRPSGSNPRPGAGLTHCRTLASLLCGLDHTARSLARRTAKTHQLGRPERHGLEPHLTAGPPSRPRHRTQPLDQGSPRYLPTSPIVATGAFEVPLKSDPVRCRRSLRALARTRRCLCRRSQPPRSRQARAPSGVDPRR